MTSTPWDRLRALHVRNGDGLPFGTFRMRSALVVAWVMVALGLTLPPWFVVDFVRLNARFGLPWDDGVVVEVLSSGLMSAIVCAGAWFGLLRPRLEVFSGGIRVVRYFDSLSVAWADIERFHCTQQLDIYLRRPYVEWPEGNLRKTYGEVEALAVGGPLRLLGVRRPGAPRHDLDWLAERLNAHLAVMQGVDAADLALTMDTAAGRRSIRNVTLAMAVVGVGCALTSWFLI